MSVDQLSRNDGDILNTSGSTSTRSGSERDVLSYERTDGARLGAVTSLLTSITSSLSWSFSLGVETLSIWQTYKVFAGAAIQRRLGKKSEQETGESDV